MQILDEIESAQSGQAMANLGAAFGISEAEARAVAQQAMPYLAVALERNTLSRGGLADVVRALGDGHHENILERPETWNDPRVVADGSAILDHILGSRYKSGALAARTAQATGVSGSIVEALLPILAQLLMGAISRYMRGGLGDILSKLPIPGGSSTTSSGPSHETAAPCLTAANPVVLNCREEIPSAGGYPMPLISDGSSGGLFSQTDNRPAGRDGGFGLPVPNDNAGRPITTDGPPPEATRCRDIRSLVLSNPLVEIGRRATARQALLWHKKRQPAGRKPRRGDLSISCAVAATPPRRVGAELCGASCATPLVAHSALAAAAFLDGF
ncbi:MAG: DUF937 domain-containing protein [Hyphomicrobiaceae bacterium]